MVETAEGEVGSSAGAIDGGGRSSGRWLYLGIAALLIAAIVVVWALGGFQTQPRRYVVVDPGSTIATGPFEFVFTSATAQRIPASDYAKASVKVLVTGTARNTGEKTDTPSTGESGMFQAYDDTSKTVEDATGQRIGDGGPSSLVPGLPAVPYEVQFDFPETYVPNDTLRFAVITQRYGATSLIQNDKSEKTWHNDNGGYQMDVPLTVLPDQKS